MNTTSSTTTRRDKPYSSRFQPRERPEASSRNPLRRWLHRFVPAGFQDMLGLTRRLLFEGKAAGRMAMLYSLAGLVLAPLDLFLELFERRLYQRAGEPRLPQIFVCGAPRSGTTLTAQVLIKHLPVFYFSNLTSLFPRAPITASKLFGRLIGGSNASLTYSSFYGRTTRLSYPNDALYLWDRWTGRDRSVIPTGFDPAVREALVAFFGAVEDYSGKPLLNKNNSLNTYAHLVAEVLPNAYFICLDRDPLYLAQSHYQARKFIHGDEGTAYGIRGHASATDDPVEDICRQVLFHRNRIREQQARIGKDRFLILDYEDFCARPAYWVGAIAEKVFGQSPDPERLAKALPPFTLANTRKLDEITFQRIRRTLTHLEEHKH